MTEPEQIDVSKLSFGLQNMLDLVERRFNLLEERIESVEQLHANLMMAYTEIATATEQIIAEVMAPRSEEERTTFRKQLSERHAQTLKTMQDVITEASHTDGVSRSLSDLVDQEPEPGDDND